jgi:hypothetical protein
MLAEMKRKCKHINKNNTPNPGHRSLGRVDPPKTIGVTRNSVWGRIRDASRPACGRGANRKWIVIPTVERIHLTRPSRGLGLQKPGIKTKTRQNNGYVPFTGEVNLGRVVALVGTGTIFLDAEIDFFLSVDTRVGEGALRIFPFDARSTIELDFSLYSRLSSFRDSVTPVRRREDTEGDGDAGVKVQIDGCPTSFLECLSNCSRQLERLDKKRLDWGKSFSERRCERCKLIWDDQI